ncbi:membrane protein [Gaetbulibacter saemankumensis]|uniref:membrane protein n=1 Tax=Gaetbulibacter saemankumensis TaxID=311208 RepID=UPI000408B602|nr:membrane protein [Gaetbulibacter saemankumensis]
MNSHKILKIIAFALAIIGAIFALMIMTGDEETAQNMSGNMLYIAYIVFGIVLAMVLVFVITGLFAGNLKKTLLTVGAFFAIILLSYAISSGTDLDLKPFTDKGQDITEATSKKVGAGLYAFYILAFLAIASMLYSGVKKIFNK